MACDCIIKWNEQLRQQVSPTAKVDCDVLSGRVIIKAIYHKQKKDGSYNTKKWEEIGLWPKFCPFCGKPYDEEKKEEK